MSLRLTGMVTITLARNYHLDHQTELRIYNTHLVLEAKMEGESSCYSLRCGTWFICDLFPSAKSPQSKQAHHCQTAKMCPDWKQNANFKVSYVSSQKRHRASHMGKPQNYDIQ